VWTTRKQWCVMIMYTAHNSCLILHTQFSLSEKLASLILRSTGDVYKQTHRQKPTSGSREALCGWKKIFFDHHTHFKNEKMWSKRASFCETTRHLKSSVTGAQVSWSPPNESSSHSV
jgi:hypothetical protein